MYYKVDFEIDYKEIDRRIKAAGEKKKLKQHNLAALAEVAATSLSHIERSASKISLHSICTTFSVRTESLLQIYGLKF